MKNKALIVTIILCTLGVGFLRWHIGLSWLASYLTMINIYTLYLFFVDKWLAGGKGRRVSEKHLQAAALLGGTPAAFLAVVLFRHKSAKMSFLIALCLILLLQIIAWVVWKTIWTSH